MLAGERENAVILNAPTELTTSAVLRLEANQSVSVQVQQTAGRDVGVVGTGQQTALGLQFLSP